MGRLLLAAALLLLSACATAGHGGGRTTARVPDFQSKVDQAPDWSDDQIIDYLSDLAETQLQDTCGGTQALRTQLDCVREAIYAGFDTTGEARGNCDDERQEEEFARCVIIGSMLYEAVAKAKPEAIADFDWKAPDAKQKTLARSLGKSVVDACLEGDLSILDRCFRDGVAEMFALTPSEAALCSGIAKSDDAVDCLLRVYTVQHFETAIRRMAAGTGKSA